VPQLPTPVMSPFSSMNEKWTNSFKTKVPIAIAVTAKKSLSNLRYSLKTGEFNIQTFTTAQRPHYY